MILTLNVFAHWIQRIFPEVAKDIIFPDKFTWMIVGDREKVEAGIRGLNFGEFQLIDIDGHPVK
ncbi:MAG: hypothetical protein CM1200mP10_30290 [Candidatus Neomarinimicrobiota bacterium]|nr:MAG: hypothetical protein CM1200mP10_30290 [Candidatus Neomarinimicrobiota bacterium]